jgi:hypothetical protein
VLFKAGDHVPVILLFDVVGSALNEVPLQIGLTAVKVGVILLGKEPIVPVAAVETHPPTFLAVILKLVPAANVNGAE